MPSTSLRLLALCALAASLGTTDVDCARAQCTLNSDCPRGYCVSNVCYRDCAADRDCPSTRPYCNDNGQCVSSAPDAGADVATDAHDGTVDASDTPGPRDVPFDLGMDIADVPVTPDVPLPDVPAVDVPSADVPSTGTRRYLDGCTSDADCASGMCTTSAPQFCTRSCTTDRDCANGQICGHGHRCALDDSGTPCDTASGTPCEEACFGMPGGAANCTHPCVTAADCAAGFACTSVSGTRVCVNIETPCATAANCPSGLGFCGAGGYGCTADCVTASDCPLRLDGTPAYTCGVAGGRMVCIPPSDVMGADAIGALCSATGTNTCRSGGCDTGVSPPSCTEKCTERGGCPPGYGCFPDQDGMGGAELVCSAAGRGWLGDTCAHAHDCITGLCQSLTPTSGYCTRLCSDGLCPTGMTCTDTGLLESDGTHVRICVM